MDQNIIFPTGGASGFVDVIIFLAMIGGYLFVAFKEYTLPKLNPAPKKDTSNMSFFRRVISFGAASQHELTEKEWESIRATRKVALPIIGLYAVILGFLASTYGLGAIMWIWLATLGGMGVRAWSDRRIEKSQQQ